MIQYDAIVRTSPLPPEHPAPALSPGISRGELPIRGRDELMVGFERSLDRSGESLTVISGRPGLGKTRLLAAVIRLAEQRGWRTLVVAPTPDSLTTPLGALTDAALAASPPMLDESALQRVLIGSHPQYWITRLLGEGIEVAAAERGLLIVVDDLQWLDAGSLGAVSALVRSGVGMPVTWLLATRPGHHQPGHARLVEQARDAGGLIELPPLSAAAIDQIGSDVLGAPAGPGLAAALAGADGSPLLALELLYGLEDEHLIRVAEGRADVLGDRPPRAFGASSRRRITALSRDALRIAQVGSLFGRRFALPAALAVLGESPGVAAPFVEELLEQDIVADDGSGLVFRHDTIRDAALESLSPSLRRALARQVIERRLADGTPPAALAGELLAFTEPGDDDSIDLLLEAARGLAATDAQTAATLIARAAELAPSNARCAAQIVALLPILWAGGHGEKVAEIGEKFAASLQGDERARVDLAVARLLTESSFTAAIALCDRALQTPGATPATRVELLAVLALNYANSANATGLRDAIARGRAEADPGRDGVALATLDATESVLTFYEERFDAAMALQRDALTRIAESGGTPSLWLPEGLWMAFMRNSLGDCRGALADVEAGLSESRRARSVIAEAFWMMLRARVLYDLGALEEARTQSEAVLDLAAELQLGDFANATAGVVLFRIALHTGDRGLLEDTRPLVTALADGTGLTRTGRWNLAVEALESSAYPKARELSELALATLDDPAPSMTTPADFLDDLMLAEICIGVEDAASLDRVRDTATRRADANPDTALVRAIAQAIDGLASASDAELKAAADTLRAGQRPLVLAHVLEVRSAVADESAAVEALEEALAVYEGVGAQRDASRVLRSLRARGVRRRSRAAAGDAAETLGLSHREWQVAEALMTGATTKQISDALLLSPHTVVTHMRHIFAKLGVNTRRDVVALLAEKRG